MLLISIAFSVLLIVGKEFKEEMSHAGMPMETRYTEPIAVYWQKPHTERSCAGNMCIHKWIKSNWTNVCNWALQVSCITMAPEIVMSGSQF